jgi:hypothetical protein
LAHGIDNAIGSDIMTNELVPHELAIVTGGYTSQPPSDAELNDCFTAINKSVADLQRTERLDREQARSYAEHARAWRTGVAPAGVVAPKQP